MSFDWDAIRGALQNLDWEAIGWAIHEGKAEALFEALMRSRDLAEWKAYLEAHPPSPEVLAIALFLGQEKHNSERARHAGKQKNAKGREKIQAIWASGKYSSRNLCAEQECDALDMSYETARKALRNTPKLNRGKPLPGEG